MVDDDVASLSGCLWSYNTLNRNDLSGEGGLVLVGVNRDSRLVKVWFGLKEIFSSKLGAIKLTTLDEIHIHNSNKLSFFKTQISFLPGSRLGNRGESRCRSNTGSNAEKGLHIYNLAKGL